MQQSEPPTPASGSAAEILPRSLQDLLWRQAALRPEKLAFAMLDDSLEIEQSLTFGELARNATLLGNALLQEATPGDRVLLAYNNGLDAVEAFWSCIAAGLIPVPAPAPESDKSRVTLERLAGIVSDAGIELALTTDDLLADARQNCSQVSWRTVAGLRQPGNNHLTSRSLPQPRPDQAAYLQYTSGSTSAPRGVEVTHQAVIAQAAGLSEAVPVNVSVDRSLIWLPWFHDYGLVHGLILPVAEGLSSFLLPTRSFLRRPLRWLSAIDKYRITHTGAPNFAYAACTQALARERQWSARLDSLRVASCGAEPVRHATLAAFADAFAPFGLTEKALAPSYGLAEAVLVVSLSSNGPDHLRLDTRALEQNRVAVVQPDDSPAAAGGQRVTDLIGCGRPLPGFTVRIVDRATNEVLPAGRVGEIWVSGASTGRGYWNNPEASRENFAQHLPGDHTAKFLRTGDLGFLHQGELYVTGRCKDLLVVHGRNVYPQDLERTAESAHQLVRENGVIAVGITRESGQEAVVLLVECRGRPAPDIAAGIAEAVRSSVAAGFEIEVHAVMLLRSGSLPRTSSGKPQRSAALRQYLEGTLRERQISCAPDTHAAATDASDDIADAVLQLVLAVWSEILGVIDPAPDADFFAQGGDSMLATQMVARLNAHLGIELPVRSVFEAGTPARLARAVRAADKADAVPALAAQSDRQQQLSFTQERMWFMHQLAPASPAYNVPLAIRLHGHLDQAALTAAVAAVVRRHEVLRAGFSAAGSGAVAATVQTPATPEIEIVDLRAGAVDSPPEPEATLTRLTGRPFALDQPPLVRFTLLHIRDGEAILLCVMHHIISDQWSCAVLGRELSIAYRAALEGTEPQLPELTLQYADFAAWQRQWFSGKRRQQQLSYWRQQLEGLQPLQLNEDFPRPRQPDFRGATVRRSLDASRLEGLTRLAESHGASLSMVMVAALKVLLMRHTGMTDIAIGLPVANRHHLSSENLLGSFVNTLVLRTDLSGSPDFAETLCRVREVSLQAYSHQDMPFEVLVRELELPHDTSRSPLFDVIFNMINTPAKGIEFPGLRWSRLDFDRGAAQFDLAVNVDAMYDPGIAFEYATALFARDTIERLADHFLRILDAAVAEVAQPVTAIQLLDEADRGLLRQWGQGLPAADQRMPVLVADEIAKQAQQSPRAPAIVARDCTRSYAELDAAANRLAMEIRTRRLGCGHTIGLCLPRSGQLPEVLLGVMRSGAAYVPLDPSYPVERLKFQAQDANIDLLIATEQSASILDWPAELTLLLDRDLAAIERHAGQPLRPDPQRDAGPDDPAYIIYTSGSTGAPKGVVVPHKAVTNFLHSMRTEPGLHADDRLLAVTTLSFDIAVLELFLPLLQGACVMVADDTQANDGAELAALLTEHDITVMQATPSRWRMLLAAEWAGKSDLRALIGGEPMPPDLAQQLVSKCSELWNMYGPTEATVWSSCWRVPPDYMLPVSLGRPIAATTLQVIDANGQPCAPGVPGELCIGGQGLALGYHRQPALTALQFVTAESTTIFPGATIYRTGDRVRWRRDGRLEHLGRVDSQLKFRGYRIEPGEIEAHLQRLEDISQALVVAHAEPGGVAKLLAYIVPTGRSASGAAECWRARLRQWLPEYMVPQHFIVLESIPMLPNGKLDRHALPPPPAAAAVNGVQARPQSVSEHELLAIWQAVLQRHDFGIYDNFFDVGGHSLLAVNLVQKITAELQVDCPLALLFQHPTVARLNAALFVNGTTARDLTAVQLLAAGPTAPLFCLSGTHLYSELAAALPAGNRVYGLLSAAEAGLLGKGSRLPDISALAQDYVATMRRLQPQGPYRLAGFSIGGVIAFEAACQLRAAGEQVELLALLDCGAPGFGWRHVVRWLKKRVLQFRRFGWGYLSRIRRELLAARSVVLPKDGDPSPPPVYPEYARVIRGYQAGHWETPLLFLQADGDPIREPGYGWLRHAPQLEVERIPGEHMDLLHGPAVLQIARRLQREFDKVREHSPADSELRYSSTVESP